MKQRALFLVPVVLAALVLSSGCASTRMAGEPAANKKVPDTQYMAAVERAAKRLPLTIIWVNPPEKKAEGSGK